MPRVNVKDKRKQQLMEANIASIAKRGLTDTTIAHVSQGAEMSRGIVNFYFTSKERMMAETLTFLADEYTSAWQDALKAKTKQTGDALAQIEAILAALLSDRMCTGKRLAVWESFLGHAGTHATYAKILRAGDEALNKKLIELWQKAGQSENEAEQRASQMQALIHGHWQMTALGMQSKRPSEYASLWMAAFTNAKSSPEKSTKEKVIKLKPAEPKKAKRNGIEVLPGQMDFGDLFSH